MKMISSFAAAAVTAVALMSPGQALAQEQPFIGQVATFGFNFCPRGWAAADGRLMPINQFTALFSLVGTQFGGDGRTNFALPDLRGRVALNTGQGPGLSPHRIGNRGGAETVTQAPAQLAPHDHGVTGTVMAVGGPGSAVTPAGNFAAINPAAANFAPLAPGGVAVAMGPGSVTGTAAPAGGGQPMPNMPPYLVMNVCIATEGLFPSRP